MNDIAVIIPVYNGEGLLEGCLDSVSSAGERIDEIIIIDDGSTDGTYDLACKLARSDSRIKVIHTENHGTYMARITGMKAAKARYVTSIDVDDRYYHGCLDMLAGLLEENDADVAMGGLVETDSYDLSVHGHSSLSVNVSNPEQFWPRIMKWKTQEFICYNNKLYKKELVSSLVDADGICQGEDVLITCQAFLEVEKMVETDAPMYLYYLNPDSLTHVAFGQHDLDVLRVWDIVVDIMKKKRPDLLPMAQFNRWRTDYTMMTRLILVDDKDTDRKFQDEQKKWHRSLKAHWRDLISPHAMPMSRELMVIGLRFCHGPVKALMRLGRRFSRMDTGTMLHSGHKR